MEWKSRCSVRNLHRNLLRIGTDSTVSALSVSLRSRPNAKTVSSMPFGKNFLTRRFVQFDAGKGRKPIAWLVMSVALRPPQSSIITRRSFVSRFTGRYLMKQFVLFWRAGKNPDKSGSFKKSDFKIFRFFLVLNYPLFW